MKRFFRENWLVTGLIVVAALQTGMFGARVWGGDTAAGDWIQVGDTLTKLQALDSLGVQTPVVDGTPSVLLVFDPACAHCGTVAPLWKEWANGPGRDVRSFAVSSAGWNPARDYVADHGWETELLTVAAESRRGLGWRLTGRTPWVFVLDGSGVVLAEGHGNRIAELTGSVLGRTEG